MGKMKIVFEMYDDDYTDKDFLLQSQDSTKAYFFDEIMNNCVPLSKVLNDNGYISIDDAMSAFDDFMCNDIEPEGQEVFLELLKDRAERSKE